MKYIIVIILLIIVAVGCVDDSGDSGESEGKFDITVVWDTDGDSVKLQTIKDGDWMTIFTGNASDTIKMKQDGEMYRIKVFKDGYTEYSKVLYLGDE